VKWNFTKKRDRRGRGWGRGRLRKEEGGGVRSKAIKSCRGFRAAGKHRGGKGGMRNGMVRGKWD